MILQRTLASSLIGLLCMLSLATASPAATSGAKSEYGEPADSDVKNFPVNALPPVTYSAKNFTFYDEPITFFEAWDKCRKLGKRLASIENYQENLAFREAMLPFVGFESSYWIAATNLGAKADEVTKYYWITNDRPVGYLSGFENWILGVAPDAADQCVAAYLGSAVWIYGPCETSFSGYACEESQDV
uniref:C-type lectin domain-containing protein n=1 Tax=Anopheles farauti TaxID=69004 RepID=A0A182QAH0_9DIPT